MQIQELEKTEVSTERAEVTPLASAIQRIRQAEAEKLDGLQYIHQTSRIRLDILSGKLKPVFDDVPATEELFIFSIPPGTVPRLWIDITCYVDVARDQHNYRLVKETRMGRIVLFQSTDIEKVATLITNYIAERIIEKEQTLEADWETAKLKDEPINVSDQDAMIQPKRIGFWRIALYTIASICAILIAASLFIA